MLLPGSRCCIPAVGVMEMVSEFLEDPYGLGVLVFSWPPQAPQQDYICVPVLTRPGGLLLALPEGSLSQQELDSDAVGDPERVVGPHQVFSVAALAEQDDGSLSPTGGLVFVLVVDFTQEVLSCIRRADPVTDGVESQGFAPEGGIFPDYPALLAEVRAWVQDEMGGPADRLAFYSAVEEEVTQVPPLGGKAKAKTKAKQATPKKLSNAHLQSQLDFLTTLLPKISDQVAGLAARQASLEDRMSAAPAPAPQPPKPHQARFLAGNPKAPMPADMMRALSGMVGPPPQRSLRRWMPQGWAT